MKIKTTICALAMSLALGCAGNRGDYEFNGQLGQSHINAYEEPGIFSDDFYVDENTSFEGKSALIHYKDNSSDDLKVDEVCIEQPAGAEETCYTRESDLGKKVMGKMQSRFDGILSCILNKKTYQVTSVLGEDMGEFKCD